MSSALPRRGIRRASTWLRLALLLLLLAVLVSTPLPAIKGWGWDFFVYRAATRALLAGENPYRSESIEAFADGPGLATIPFYVYAPAFSFVVLPFSLLGPEVSFRLWFVLNLLLVAASSALVLNLLDHHPTAPAVLLGGLALALYPPVRTLLAIGQSAGLLLFALTVSLFFLKRSRPALAGISFGLGLFKPHLLIMTPLLALRRQWTVLGVGAIFAVLINLLFVGYFDDWWRAMLATRAVNLSAGCLPFAGLPALLQCVFPAASVATVQALASIGLLALGVVLVLPEAAPDSVRFVLQSGFVLCLGLLLLDNVRVADLTLEVLPLLACVVVAPRISRPALRRAALFFVMLAYVIPLASDVGSIRNPMWAMPVWYSVSTMALTAASAIVLVADRTGSTRTA